MYVGPESGVDGLGFPRFVILILPGILLMYTKGRLHSLLHLVSSAPCGSQLVSHCRSQVLRTLIHCTQANQKYVATTCLLVWELRRRLHFSSQTCSLEKQGRHRAFQNSFCSTWIPLGCWLTAWIQTHEAT